MIHKIAPYLFLLEHSFLFTVVISFFLLNPSHLHNFSFFSFPSGSLLFVFFHLLFLNMLLNSFDFILLATCILSCSPFTVMATHQKCLNCTDILKPFICSNIPKHTFPSLTPNLSFLLIPLLQLKQ